MNVQETEAILQKYEQEIAAAQQQQQMNPNAYATTMFGGMQKQNLIEFELDFKPELESIERLLRCDIIVREKDGNEYWATNPDKSKVFFNDLGVNDIMRNIILLVNKNKALSNYTPDEVNARVKQIKHELRVLIYNQYEQYGMDNDYKMNNYSMIVLSVGSVVEDIFRRAIAGETHRGLNEQRIVNQNENIMPAGMPYPMMMQQSKKKSWIKPWTWGN